MTTPTSPRVTILQLTPAALEALAQADLVAAGALVPVPLTPWLASDDVTGTWRRRARQVVETPDDLPWITGLIWDEQREQVVGCAGFHAEPDADGMVEVGYAVDPAQRRRGYARAALEALLARARAEPAARTFRLTISPDNEPSLALMRQYPFAEVGEQWDEEDGLEIIYELGV